MILPCSIMMQNQSLFNTRMKTTIISDRRLVSSVGRALDCCEGGRGLKPRPDQHSGSLNNLGESAAFVITSANG